MEAKRVTTQRKRSACGQLRSLALELGVENANAHLDMTIRQFESFATDLEQHCATPEQRAKLQTAVAEFHARPAPPLPGSGAADANVQSAGPAPPAQNAGSAGSGPSSQQGFRLRSQGCLFTYNSINFGEVIWGDFVAWLATLECSARWSATMEKSLKSEDWLTFSQVQRDLLCFCMWDVFACACFLFFLIFLCLLFLFTYCFFMFFLVFLGYFLGFLLLLSFCDQQTSDNHHDNRPPYRHWIASRWGQIARDTTCVSSKHKSPWVLLSYPHVQNHGGTLAPSTRPTVQPMHDRTLHGGSTHIPEVFFVRYNGAPSKNRQTQEKQNRENTTPQKNRKTFKKTNQRAKKKHIEKTLHVWFEMLCAWPSRPRPLPAPRLNNKSGEISHETHENQWYLVTGHSKKAQLNNYQVLDFQDLAKSWIAKTWFYI